jgi:hypothetical protein
VDSRHLQVRSVKWKQPDTWKVPGSSGQASHPKAGSYLLCDPPELSALLSVPPSPKELPDTRVRKLG